LLLSDISEGENGGCTVGVEVSDESGFVWQETAGNLRGLV